MTARFLLKTTLIIFGSQWRFTQRMIAEFYIENNIEVP
ncbi:hypothetical protein SAMN05421785_101272 [Chryseobacterium gambrini]|uniref:Uncharacterized protein n=1 Tax=Chryseobacterium gambrini TaxID=373672 RepID=A0A1N7K4J8_9FLAO|nr:hypothetical protein SAMN05421785_101272 [Chryseobacterium gambrini]